MILAAQALYTAGGVVSASTALNALSSHGACTVLLALASAAMVTAFSSVRTFARLGWLTWAGFATFLIAVLVFVGAVARQARPAAAPATGPFDLGFVAVPATTPSFADGMTATANIFLAGSGASMYLPVMAEMRSPRAGYRRAVYVNGALVGAMYLVFSLVIFRYCGQWLTTPAFGSAGPLVKKVAYGLALPGLVIGNGIYQHVAAKYLFVRLLRGSRHLQAGTPVHWVTWLSVNALLGSLAFVISQAVPILDYILGLAGSLFSAPFCLLFPVLFWMHDNKGYRTLSIAGKARWWLHVLIFLLGSFMVIGGT